MSEYYGIYPAFVKSVKDPEKRGRIKVTCPEVLGNAISGWCEPCVPVAYDGGGDFCIPPLEEAVWVTFIEGDVNRPVYMGGWWSKSKNPLKGKYSGVTQKRIISFGKCKIEMKKDKMTLSVKDNKIELTDSDIKINGISFKNHTHTGAHGETSPPH